MANLNELLSKHVTLEVECLDRLLLNGYIPRLQTAGQLVTFLTQHRGFTVPSPVLLGKMTGLFKAAVEAFSKEREIPLVTFQPGECKEEIAAKHRKTLSEKEEGVYLIGVAQEKASAFRGRQRATSNPAYVGFDFDRRTVNVNHYYFYLQDHDFGPAFIKIGTYAPYPVKVYVNGHEWVKNQLRKKAIPFVALDNGFLSCEQPVALQAICDQLGPEQIQAFFQKWLSHLPLPLTREDRDAGYDWWLSIWQMEVSRTQVFTQPLRGRQFFDELIRDNFDLGRPDRIQLVFDRKILKTTPGRFRTQVVHTGVSPRLSIDYKKCHIKQYFKEQRALRTETTINNTKDFNLGKNISHLRALQAIGRTLNRRLLEVQRISHACMLDQETVEQVTEPTLTPEGQRCPGLRFGDPRVLALFWALTLFCHLPRGFTNASLRCCVADLLGPGTSYQANQMTYDLRRLSRKGLIQRRGKSHRYRLTPYGRKVVLFFTKLEARVFRPAFACITSEEPIPRPLATALQKVDSAINELLEDAHLSPAA